MNENKTPTMCARLLLVGVVDYRIENYLHTRDF